MVGVWLYLMQIEVLAWRRFVLVRRYGLWGALRWRRLRVSFGRTGISGSEQFRRRKIVATLISVPFMSGTAAAVLPLLVGTFAPNHFIELDNILARTTILSGLLGAAIGSACWLQGLSYVARPSTSDGGGDCPPFIAQRTRSVRPRSFRTQYFLAQPT